MHQRSVEGLIAGWGSVFAAGVEETQRVAELVGEHRLQVPRVSCAVQRPAVGLGVDEDVGFRDSGVAVDDRVHEVGSGCGFRVETARGPIVDERERVKPVGRHSRAYGCALDEDFDLGTRNRGPGRCGGLSSGTDLGSRQFRRSAMDGKGHALFPPPNPRVVIELRKLRSGAKRLR